MERIREALSAGMLRRIEKEIGREATLRQLWPSIVGERLAESTHLKGIRSRTLVIAVPDRAWISSLQTMKDMILSPVNRSMGGAPFEEIDLVEEPQAFPARKAATRGKRDETGVSKASKPDFAASIADPELRRIFETSAIKYLSARREPHR